MIFLATKQKRIELTQRKLARRTGELAAVEAIIHQAADTVPGHLIQAKIDLSGEVAALKRYLQQLGAEP